MVPPVRPRPRGLMGEPKGLIKKAPASPKVYAGAISVFAVRVEYSPPGRTPSPGHKLRPRLIECKDYFPEIVNSNRTNVSIYVDVDVSPFQRQDDDACSNEKYAKPLPGDRAFTEEQNRKESHEHEAQLVNGRDL